MQRLLGVLTSRSEEETKAIAARFATVLDAPACVCLSGEIGAGKSVFARAVIRAVLDDPDLDVPSPTYTLVQTYEGPRFDVWHFDLYRLSDASEVLELGLDDALAQAVTLIEWPERLGPDRPDHALWIGISGDTDTRTLRVEGGDPWKTRLEGMF